MLTFAYQIKRTGAVPGKNKEIWQIQFHSITQRERLTEISKSRCLESLRVTK